MTKWLVRALICAARFKIELPSAAEPSLWQVLIQDSVANPWKRSGQGPLNLLPENFFDLPDLFLNFADVAFGAAFRL